MEEPGALSAEAKQRKAVREKARRVNLNGLCVTPPPSCGIALCATPFACGDHMGMPASLTCCMTRTAASTTWLCCLTRITPRRRRRGLCLMPPRR